MFFHPIIVSIILVASFTGSVEAQNKEGVFGTIKETVGDISQNMTCAALRTTTRAAIAAHPDWHQWLYETRQNQSDFIEKCAENESGDVHDFLEEQRDTLRCPESRSRMTVVSTIFIVAFLLSLIAAITFGTLFYRKR
uniref:Uncharacterized protein n=1 Tax=Globodera rostochiensis TaxID=31243 RepID=A0A914I709_GLORO